MSTRKDSPSDRRRRARYAIEKARQTAEQIEAKAHERHEARLACEANKAQTLTTDLNGMQDTWQAGLYGDFREEKMRVRKAAGQVHGPEYDGRRVERAIENGSIR